MVIHGKKVFHYAGFWVVIGLYHTIILFSDSSIIKPTKFSKLIKYLRRLWKRKRRFGIQQAERLVGSVRLDLAVDQSQVKTVEKSRH